MTVEMPPADGWLVPTHKPGCAVYGEPAGACNCGAPDRPWFREATLLAYGRLCADAAIERCAQLLEFPYPDDVAAAAIRALKGQP